MPANDGDESVDHYLDQRQAMYRTGDGRALPVPSRLLTVSEMLLAQAQQMVAMERRQAAQARELAAMKGAKP